MIEIIGLAILAFMIADWFEPLMFIKDKLKLYNYRLTSWLYCEKCVGFWLGLIVTKSIFSAALVSVLAYTISYFIDKINRDRYEN
jgi:hypothetical protein